MSDNKQGSFWGEISADSAERTPITVLNEQAAAISQLTNLHLKGVVSSAEAASYQSFDFEASLDVLAPTLNNYRLEIVKIYFPLEFFPLKLSVPHTKNEYELRSLEAFEPRLKRILQSDGVMERVRKLLAHARSV